MTAVTDDFRAVLLRELQGLQREVALYPDDESLWVTRKGVANAGGNLALHVAGNIQDFIGRALGGRVYHRDREAEFARRSGTRAEVVEELRRAAAIVDEVLPGLSDERLETTFDGHPDTSVSTRRFLLHLCTHAAFHLGQVGYLRRILTGDPRSTNSVSAALLKST
jgi:uncharacterized damage-inducible protein DinB